MTSPLARKMARGNRKSYRNKFPRPQGQGLSRMEKVFTGISGSQTGGQGVIDISIPELVQPNGNFGTWPLNLPAAGAQTEVSLNVPCYN